MAERDAHIIELEREKKTLKVGIQDVRREKALIEAHQKDDEQQTQSLGGQRLGHITMSKQASDSDAQEQRDAGNATLQSVEQRHSTSQMFLAQFLISMSCTLPWSYLVAFNRSKDLRHQRSDLSYPRFRPGQAEGRA